MNSEYPVVVYGASGYTGRLVVEHLRELGISFVAAGRSRARIEESLKLVPGIEDAKYIIEEVEHSVEGLTKLMEGRKVICNTVGPFMRYADAVAQACLNAGAHYLDTSGEQSVYLMLKEKFSADFEKAGLVLITSTAYMYAVSEIGARYCLETRGIDSLRMHAVGQAVPTVASAQTILDAVRYPSYYLKDRELVKYDGVTNGQWATPSGEVLTTSQWGGTMNPLWFAEDGRIRNCKMDVAIWNQELYKKELEIERAYKVSLQWVPEEQLAGIIDTLAKGVTAGTPPRESRQVHRSIDVCFATGNNIAVKSTLISTGGYYTTGLLQAYCASRLVKDKPSVCGLQSPSKVFGHRDLMAMLQNWGYASIKVEKIVEPGFN